ncbi:MESP1 protein, partial [Formicarius rufipectus]|nr:MESP1 protein [Formicarius rufipectus]
PSTAKYNAASPASSAESPCASRCPPRGRKGSRGGGEPGVPRQSASEQEKLRMRRYLAPAGQSLTKIETLRLAARYIAHLSALLGLDRASPAPRHCPLCPRGLGCCRDTGARDAGSPGTVGWGSPATAEISPELHGAPGMGTAAWGSPSCGSAVGTPPEVFGGPDRGLQSWESPLYIPVTGNLPELHGAVASAASPWLTPPHSAGAEPLPDLPGDPLPDTGLVLPEFIGSGTVTQDLSADLLSLLEALLPPQHRH